jgi:hypothetical protein
MKLNIRHGVKFSKTTDKIRKSYSVRLFGVLQFELMLFPHAVGSRTLTLSITWRC